MAGNATKGCDSETKDEIKDSVSSISELNELQKETRKLCISQVLLYPKHLTTLDISNLNLKVLPDELSEFISLKSINFSVNQLTVIPPLLEKFQFLEEILGRDNLMQNLDQSELQINESKKSPEKDSIYTDEELSSPTLPQQELDFSVLSCLRSVDLSGNLLVEFPPSLCNIHNLIKLNLSRNKLRSIPVRFSSYSTLKHLVLEGNGFPHLYELPPWLFYISRCSVLSFAFSYLGSIVADIPCDFGSVCRQVLKLDLRSTGLKEFPLGFTGLLDLEVLLLSNLSTDQPSIQPGYRSVYTDKPTHQPGYRNVLWTLPKELCNLVGLVHLEASGIHLTKLPDGLGSLRSLEILDVSRNSIFCIPEDLVNLSRLRSFNISDNKITHLPSGISKLNSLTLLNISLNSIWGLPQGIAELENLEILDAYSNQISELPSSFSSLNLIALVGTNSR
jgi:Leucine-rich repeat (LRR) protein